MRYSLCKSKPDAANAVDIVDDAVRYDNANAAYAAYIVDDAERDVNAVLRDVNAKNAVQRDVKRDVKRDAVYPSCYIFSFPISSSGRRMNQNNYTTF